MIVVKARRHVSEVLQISKPSHLVAASWSALKYLLQLLYYSTSEPISLHRGKNDANLEGAFLEAEGVFGSHSDETDECLINTTEFKGYWKC